MADRTHSPSGLLALTGNQLLDLAPMLDDAFSDILEEMEAGGEM